MSTRYLKEVHVRQYIRRDYTLLVEIDTDDDCRAEDYAKQAIDYGVDYVNGLVENTIREWNSGTDQGVEDTDYITHDRGEVERCDDCGEEDAYCCCVLERDDEDDDLGGYE